jgi:toxin ParE1/3/4
LGTLWGDEAPELLDARHFPVDRFRKYLIFYRPIEGGIELLRVLHGARNLEQLLSPKEPE